MPPQIEAALLAGGASRRMGQDKALLPVDGEPLGRRIVRLLDEIGVATTVLGKSPLSVATLLPDDDTVRGPLDALRRFRPRADFVFVLSVDLPAFDPRLVARLFERVGDHDAAAPFVDGFRQPLVALYRREAFDKIDSKASCPMDWLSSLDVRLLDESELGPLANATRGANTPKEWAELTGEAPR